MLVRTDPFRDLDRITQQLLGTAARPAAMPMDAYRQDDTFYIHFDLPGIRAESIELTVEQSVLTVRAERRPCRPRHPGRSGRRAAAGRMRACKGAAGGGRGGAPDDGIRS
jgi:HSP20 family molecular chaperone IbpA